MGAIKQIDGTKYNKSMGQNKTNRWDKTQKIDRGKKLRDKQRTRFTLP
jgi:hypothetical protein